MLIVLRGESASLGQIQNVIYAQRSLGIEVLDRESGFLRTASDALRRLSASLNGTMKQPHPIETANKASEILRGRRSFRCDFRQRRNGRSTIGNRAACRKIAADCPSAGSVPSVRAIRVPYMVGQNETNADLETPLRQFCTTPNRLTPGRLYACHGARHAADGLFRPDP